MPAKIRSYIWEHCFDPFDLEIIAGEGCIYPGTEIELLAILEKLRENDQLLNELRSWGSTLEVGLTFYNDRINSVKEVVAVLKEEVNK